MSYEQEAINYDSFGEIKDNYPDCEWIVISVAMKKRGPKKPLTFKVVVGAFPFTIDAEGERIYEGKYVKTVTLLDIEDLVVAFPDLYATVGTAIYVEGKAADGSRFIDAAMA